MSATQECHKCSPIQELSWHNVAQFHFSNENGKTCQIQTVNFIFVDASELRKEMSILEHSHPEPSDYFFQLFLPSPNSSS